MSTTVTDAVAESFVIEGARSLNGTIRASGNKNGALEPLERQDVADRAEETGDHVEAPAQAEVPHVTLVERDSGEALTRDREQLRLEIEPFAAVPAAELGEVRSRAARHVEKRLRAGLPGLDELVDEHRLARVVLEGVDSVVEPCAGPEHPGYAAWAAVRSPSSRAIGCIAATTVRMWSSRSTPSSSAPL